MLINNTLSYFLSYFRNLCILCIIVATPHLASSQNVGKIPVKSINNYITYSNESIHGLLIIHRLLELYNQELNKYVDLPHYQLNLFSNADFPENIFKDKTGSYYRISPYQLYDICIDESKFMPTMAASKCNSLISDMKEITDQLEKDRYAIGTLVENTDKTHIENLTNIYDALDECVIKYDSFEAKRKELSQFLATLSPSVNSNSDYSKIFLNALYKYENQVHISFDALRKENVTDALPPLRELLVNLKSLNNALDKVKASKLNQYQSVTVQDLIKVIIKQTSEVNTFLAKPVAPESFTLYGPCYYFYNTQLTGTTNKYGTGIIERSNELSMLMGNNYKYAFERPHFFKVIRPKKILEKPDSSAIVIPVDKIEIDRKIVRDRGKVMTSLNQKMLIEVYDHEEFDHDTIDLNFNGKWILKNQLISKEPIRLYLPLVKGKENYLILHAVNLGTKPPNTCAIRYQTKNGKYDVIVLHSDFNQSEMIQIHYD